MGKNLDLCHLLGIENEATCPLCHQERDQSFDDYDIDRPGANDVPGAWRLSAYCEPCDHNWGHSFTLTPVLPIRSDQKYMSLQEFVDAGLLFQVNKQVLHPLGIALSVMGGKDGRVLGFGPIWDQRADPEGIIFAGSTYWGGFKKWVTYLNEKGRKAWQKRREGLDYLVQSETPFEVGDTISTWRLDDHPDFPRHAVIHEVDFSQACYHIEVTYTSRMPASERVAIGNKLWLMFRNAHEFYYLDKPEAGP